MKTSKRIICAILFLISFINYSQTNRPQEPKIPFEYLSEDIKFENINANSIKLSGTLTLPKGIKKPPVAILISGSGPQNRDAEFFNHKWFLVLSDYLTNNGIAVLRYDERGIGESEGVFKTATTIDLASDVEAAITYLKTRKDIDTSKIGLLGHSEGGVIAPIVASQNKSTAFIVLFAGPGVSGDQILYTQNEKIMTLSGAIPEATRIQLDISKNLYHIVKTEPNDSIASKISSYLDKYMIDHKDNEVLPYILNNMTKQQFLAFSKPWLREFVRLDPEPFLLKTTCPVLALNGSKDVQVLPEVNLKAIQIALEKAGNDDVTIKELEGLNHLFQTAKTGMSYEYSVIEETISPEVLILVKDWILKRFN